MKSKCKYIIINVTFSFGSCWNFLIETYHIIPSASLHFAIIFSYYSIIRRCQPRRNMNLRTSILHNFLYRVQNIPICKDRVCLLLLTLIHFWPHLTPKYQIQFFAVSISFGILSFCIQMITRTTAVIYYSVLTIMI